MMRALGPGSVSSFLKIVVDVVYVSLCVGAGGLLLTGLATLLLQPFTGVITQADLELFHPPGGDLRALQPLAISLALLALAAYALGLVVVFNRLRRVFATLTQGDPFHPENVGRLRMIGLALISLEVLGGVLRPVLAQTFLRHGRAGVSFNLTAWFAILVIFVLAEVFREGARLRRDAELTI